MNGNLNIFIKVKGQCFGKSILRDFADIKSTFNYAPLVFHKYL